MKDTRDDLTLFEQVKEGSDKNAYSILYLRYHAALRAYASLFGGLDDAEDVVQEVDLRLSLLDEGADFNRHQLEELKSLIRKALSELPYEQRRAFEMSRFEGKTYEQIARETGVSVKTVEYRISQALRKLEVSLADYLPVYIGIITYLFANWR